MRRKTAAVVAVLLVLLMTSLLVGCNAETTEDYQNPATQNGEQKQNITTQQPVFGREDTAAIIGKYSAVGEYLSAVAPIETSWEYSEEDGSTRLTMIASEGWVVVKAFLPENEVNSTTVPSPIVVDVSALSEAVLDTQCELCELQWDSAEMADVFEYPRGIGIGATVAELLAAFPNELQEGQYGALYSNGESEGRIEPLDGYGGAVSYAFRDDKESCTLNYTIDEEVVCINLLCE